MIGYCIDSSKQLIALDVVVTTAYLVPLSLQTYSPRENSRKMELWQFGLILSFGFGVDLIDSTDFYSLTVSDLQGNSVPMSVFKGKVSVY